MPALLVFPAPAAPTYRLALLVHAHCLYALLAPATLTTAPTLLACHAPQAPALQLDLQVLAPCTTAVAARTRHSRLPFALHAQVDSILFQAIPPVLIAVLGFMLPPTTPSAPLAAEAITAMPPATATATSVLLVQPAASHQPIAPSAPLAPMLVMLAQARARTVSLAFTRPIQELARSAQTAHTAQL